jgi:hypothetical protein
MTTRNFRVNNGISIGDVVISASTNKITGLSTSAPSADGDVATKKYVDDSLNALSSTSINTDSNATNVTVSGSGASGTITLTANSNNELVVNDTNATFSGDVIVTGNLTVSGTATYLDVNNLSIEDNLLVVAKNNSGGSDLDSGIMVERGSAGNNAAFYWNEGDDKFKAVLTTSTPDATAVTDSSTATIVANLEGTATAAEYSDVAERFASDTAYEAGTVVALGGAAEITAVNEEASDEVFGVISSLDQAAFKMNGGAGTDETHPYIAMTGRVDVKVIGTVNKGDRLVSASVPGYARAATKAECTAFNVIGRALANKTTSGQGSVLAAVRVSH